VTTGDRAYSMCARPAVTSGGLVAVTGNGPLLPLPKKTTPSLVFELSSQTVQIKYNGSDAHLTTLVGHKAPPSPFYNNG
jgi:hypothetical protein